MGIKCNKKVEAKGMKVKTSVVNASAAHPSGKISEGPLENEEGIINIYVDPMVVIWERQNLDEGDRFPLFEIFDLMFIVEPDNLSKTPCYGCSHAVIFSLFFWSDELCL